MRRSGPQSLPRSGLRRKMAIGLACALLSGGLGWGAEAPPDEEELRSIEERGRRIHLHERAIAEARERLAGRLPPPTRGDREVVVERERNWHVYFLKGLRGGIGSGSEKRKAVARATFKPGTGKVTKANTVRTPRVAPDDVRAMAKAIELAVGASAARPEVVPPFDEACFVEEDGMFSVYLKSRDQEPGLVTFGSDLMVTVSADGRQVKGLEVLHAAPTRLPLPEESSGQLTVHTHTTGNLPTATDVAMILKYPTLAPHLVLTPDHVFRIDADGVITYRGPSGADPSGSGGAP